MLEEKPYYGISSSITVSVSFNVGLVHNYLLSQQTGEQSNVLAAKNTFN